MSYKREKDSDIREALSALLSDIEAMYQGAEVLEEGGQPEEFFGPFFVCRLGHAESNTEIAISWPNLAISMRNAKTALDNTGKGSA